MDLDRRSSRRSRVSFFCNQYIDGFPYLSEALEMSMSGALIRRVLGPELDSATYALEIGGSSEEGEPAGVWVCATPIWRHGPFEAVQFVAQSLTDRLKLANLLGQTGDRCLA